MRAPFRRDITEQRGTFARLPGNPNAPAQITNLPNYGSRYPAYTNYVNAANKNTTTASTSGDTTRTPTQEELEAAYADMQKGFSGQNVGRHINDAVEYVKSAATPSNNTQAKAQNAATSTAQTQSRDEYDANVRNNYRARQQAEADARYENFDIEAAEEKLRDNDYWTDRLLESRRQGYGFAGDERIAEERSALEQEIKRAKEAAERRRERYIREKAAQIPENKPGDMLRWSAGNMPSYIQRNRERNSSEKPIDLIGKIKDGVTTFSNYRKDNSLVNTVSKTLNHYQVLDDVTNGFFKTYDFMHNKNYTNVPVKQAHIPFKAANTIFHKVLEEANYKNNQNVDLSKYENGGFINDQNVKNSKMAELKYGIWDMYNNGCELIAVFNSLNSLNNRKNITDIAKEFENNGQTLYGLLGTSPFVVGDYFRKNGYDVKTYDGDKEIMNLSIPDADSYILSFWNNDRFTSAIHTVSVSPQSDGSYRIYNSDGRSEEIVSSLQEYLNKQRKNGKRVPLVLHCISKKGS